MASLPYRNPKHVWGPTFLRRRRKDSSRSSVQLPHQLRLTHKRPAQGIVEYGLVLLAFLGIFVVAAAALTAAENGYFNALAPRLAPPEATFEPLPTNPPTVRRRGPRLQADRDPGPTVTPRPTQTGNHDTTLTLDCGATSAIVTGSSSYSTTCTVTVQAANGGDPTGDVQFYEFPDLGAYSPAGSPPTCTLARLNSSTGRCQITYTTTSPGSRYLIAYYPGTTGATASAAAKTRSRWT